MSQLYQLFCEGLKSRREELSSTLLVTSTPLEQEIDAASGGATQHDAESIGPEPAVEPVNPNCHSEEQAQAQVQDQCPTDAHGPVSSSLEPQIGSAEPENPSDEVVRSPESAAFADNLLSKTLKGKQTNGKNASPVPSDKVVRSPESAAFSDNLLSKTLKRKETNGKNVSSVDFIDHIIAIKRRDEALSRKRQVDSSNSASNNESGLHTTETVAKVRRNNTKSSDSSETDFEGAVEYFKKHPVPSTRGPNVNPSRWTSKENVPCSHLSDDESNMHLVMQSVSAGSSSTSNQSILPNSQSSSVLGVETPPAARCRVYPLKQRNHELKSSYCEPNLRSQENLQGGIELKAARVVLTRLSCSYIGTQQQSKKELSAQQSDSDKGLSDILKGVIAYVEYRSGHDNRSMGIRTQLRSLGATVVEKFDKSVTHVLFNEGSPHTLQRSRSQGCHLVSVLWIDECKRLRQIAPEENHPPLNLHLYDQPHFLSKYRKMKSLQPDFEDGKGEERLNKYIKRIRRKAQQEVSHDTSNSFSTEERTSSNDDNEDAPVPNEERCDNSLPKNVILRPLSIVLNKLDTADHLTASSSVLSDKKNKRRLMPLKRQTSVTLEDFDPTERFRPECPYTQPSSKQKKVLPTRKSPRQGSHSQSQQLFGRSQKPQPVSSASMNRRRSSCFVRRQEGLLGSQYRQKKTKIQMRTMVCTFMHRREIDVVAAVLKQLGGWILEPTVSPKTTHVVCGDEKRTINLLRGIAHGCWILRQEWVLRSLEAGHWLDEEPFEITVFPAVQRCRVARETLGVLPDIFSSVGNIYVSKETTPPRSDMLDLLELCGGHIVKTPRQAKVIIGQCQRRVSCSGVIQVTEQWVLNSIQESMLQPLRHYCI